MKFAGALSALRAEGRYREFAEIRRHCGSFPSAHHFRKSEVDEIKVLVFK